RSFKIFNKSIKIKVENHLKKKLTILIEKALNCVGCGTCIAKCPTEALSYKDSYLHLDVNKCIHCNNCLDTTTLRGGCIIRNYSPLRDSIEKE
ncbi:MAG: 4Fe-4S dicluster domain-containing protein, partial [Promethearchaeota archaeon]